jgi:hypothetical protein
MATLSISLPDDLHDRLQRRKGGRHHAEELNVSAVCASALTRALDYLDRIDAEALIVIEDENGIKRSFEGTYLGEANDAQFWLSGRRVIVQDGRDLSITVCDDDSLIAELAVDLANSNDDWSRAIAGQIMTDLDLEDVVVPL